MTVKVWVLVFFLVNGNYPNYAAGGPMIIDNIATKEDCLRLGTQIKEHYGNSANLNKFTCFTVNKIGGE